MEYDLIVKVDASELTEAVNEAIANGWTPQGGASISALTYEYTVERKGYTEREFTCYYAQAMTKETKA